MFLHVTSSKQNCSCPIKLAQIQTSFSQDNYWAKQVGLISWIVVSRLGDVNQMKCHLACMTFTNLKHLRCRHDIALLTKGQIHKSVIGLLFVYGSDTWHINTVANTDRDQPNDIIMFHDYGRGFESSLKVNQFPCRQFLVSFSQTTYPVNGCLNFLNCIITLANDFVSVASWVHSTFHRNSRPGYCDRRYLNFTPFEC